MIFSKKYKTISETYPEPSQTSKMELFVKIVYSWNPLAISTKNFITDVRLCSKYTSDFTCKPSLGWQGSDIPNTHEKSTKSQSLTKWYRCGNCGVMG